jgi:hypothetical protein
MASGDDDLSPRRPVYQVRQRTDSPWRAELQPALRIELIALRVQLAKANFGGI